MITRRAWLGGAGSFLAAGPALAGQMLALLVPSRVGAGPDQRARGFLPFLNRHLPAAEAAIRNLPGDAGLTGIQALASASPNGGTIGWVTTPTLPARMVDRDSAGLLSRITLLGAVQKEPVVFVCPAAAPMDAMQELVSRSAEDADAVPLGTPPPGSPPHLAALRLQAVAGTRLNIVTFPSAAAARQAVSSGNVAAAALALSEALPLLREEKLAGLGVAAHKRSGAFPDMPSLQEAGLPLSAFITCGIGAPAGLGDDIAAPLVSALRASVADPDFAAAGEARGFHPVWIEGPAWTAEIEAERESLARLWSTDPWLPGAGQ